MLLGGGKLLRFWSGRFAPQSGHTSDEMREPEADIAVAYDLIRRTCGTLRSTSLHSTDLEVEARELRNDLTICR